QLFFFFFQAEDGIRDRNVTGVQTCALPIYGPRPLPRSVLPRRIHHNIASMSNVTATTGASNPNQLAPPGAALVLAASVCATATRSEERRVGKGWSGGRRGN